MVSPGAKWIKKGFATFAVGVMILTAFAVVSRPVSADGGTMTASGGGPPTATTYGPGAATTRFPDGTVRTQYLPTFQRWDGVWRPESALNWSAGEWPYLANETTTSFAITRLGGSFTQGKVPGATYAVHLDQIKETVNIASPFPTPITSPSLTVPFSGSYYVAIAGTTITLIGSAGTSWRSAPFAAWDSATPAHTWDNLATSVAYIDGSLVISLDANAVSGATFPLYIDPTWILQANANNAWAGTLDHLTSDWGDQSLRIGYLADNFNDNKNEVWTKTSGNSFSLRGGRAQLTATEIHASGTWSDLVLGSTLNFASCGASKLLVRYASSSNYYYLNVNFAGKQVTLYKVIGGVTTALSSTLSISMSANTNYDAKVVARGNSFEIWWAGARVWTGTDPSPPGSPLSGNVGLSEVTSKCTLYADNVRVRDATKWSGDYTSASRDAGTSNVVTQVRFQGTADSYSDVDLWINSSSNNQAWGGWHLLKAMVAPGFYYAVPDIDQKRWYQLRAVMRTGVDGTAFVHEMDALETPPTGVQATTNTGFAPWYIYVAGDVNAVSGNLVISWTDLSTRAKGFPIALVRTYNSALSGTAGPFGLGTMDGFHAKLSFPAGGNVTYTAGDGAVYIFTTMGGTAYSPPRGIHDNLVKNADGTYTLWQPDGSRTNFDSTGKLTSIVDRNGNHLTLTYTNGNPTRVADDSGLALTFVYDSSNRISFVTDPMNRRVGYTYDGSNRLVTFTDAMTFSENYSYDSSNRLTQRVDRAGHVDRFVYDASSRVSQIWTGEWNYASNAIRWQVEAYGIGYTSGTQTTVTNAAGSTTTITFNSLGNPTVLNGPNVGGFGCGLCTKGNSSQATWDGEFDILTATDGRTDTTAYSYDWMGNAVSTRDPGGNTTLQTFSNVQNATQFIALRMSQMNQRGYVTRYTYYTNGNLYATILPGGNVSYQFYDAAGSVVRSQDFRGNSVTASYDAHEFLVNSTDAGGNKTTYQNDAIGRTWNTTSPGGNTTRNVYDSNGRVTSVTDPMGNVTWSTYDHRGDLLTRKDANLLITQYAYNMTFGGVQQIVDTGGNITKYVHNNLGEQTQTTDRNNHATRYAYDAFGRVTNVTTPLGHVTRFVYDAVGNDIVKILANGTRINYTYDASNRLVKTTYPGAQAITVAYNKDGNVVERRGFELDEIFVYDALDRVSQTRQIFLDVSMTLFHNFTYDANGNRLSMDGNGGGIYVWDRSNRVSSQTDAAGSRWAYAYGKDGQLLKETYPNGGYVTYAYDRGGRLVLETAYQPGGSVLEKLAYVYDKVGNVVTQQTPQTTEAISTWTYSDCCDAATDGLTASGLAPSPQTVTVSVYAHGVAVDNVNSPPSCAAPTVTWYYVLNGIAVQIGSQTLNLNKPRACYASFGAQFSASVSVRNGDVLSGKIAFQNDSVVTTTISSLSVSFQTATNPSMFVYDREYRLANATYPSGTSTKYTYDAFGNRLTSTSGGTTVTSTYDADNELTSSTDGTSYSYDANGNLISRTVGAVTTHFAYDYANNLAPVSTTQLVSSSCSSCTTTSSVRLLTLLPSPQSKTISVTGSGSVFDDVDYPNCPTVTVSWSYKLNGGWYQVGSQALTLIPNTNYLFCHAAFSGTYSSASPVSLNSGNTLAGQVVLDPAGSSAYLGTTTTVSMAAGTLNVAPYELMQYGPDGLLSSETVNQGSVTQHFDYDLLGIGGFPRKVADYKGASLGASYFFGPGSNRPLDMIVANVSYYYHRNLEGSITTLTDASGAVQASYHY
ncbi:MAG TPA: DUF6531 domain-containing protein, partial [Thermoplasmata archaeon]